MKRSNSSFANKALALAAERFNTLPPEQRRAMRPALEGHLKVTRLSAQADTSKLEAAMRRATSNDPSKARAHMTPVMWMMPAYSESDLHRYRPPAQMPAEATQPEAREEPETPDTTAQPEATQPETKPRAERREARPLLPWRIAIGGRDHQNRIARVVASDRDGAHIAAFGVKRGPGGRISELVREDQGMPAA